MAQRWRLAGGGLEPALEHGRPTPSPESGYTRMSPPQVSLLLLLSVHSALALRICSFNVRSFGGTKKENRDVMDVIVKVSPFSVRRVDGHPSHPLSTASRLEELH